MITFDGNHIYLSTACLHGLHEYCGNTRTLKDEPKIPACCKWCEAPCLCECHKEEQ